MKSQRFEYKSGFVILRMYLHIDSAIRQGNCQFRQALLTEWMCY